MFNLGFSEILIIGVLALLLIGPKQLPEVAKILGRMINEFKKATTDLSGGLLEMKEELKKLGFIRRDPRKVERKHFGLKKARKASQWSKR